MVEIPTEDERPELFTNGCPNANHPYPQQWYNEYGNEYVDELAAEAED